MTPVTTARHRRPAVAAWLRVAVLSAAALPVLVTLASPAGAQTVERRRERHATGAATIIYPEEVAQGALDLADLIQWNVPGAIVTRGQGDRVHVRLRPTFSAEASDCTPGGGSEINNPLLIINGIPVSDNSVAWELSTLHPAEVERIEVIRDRASASVYGMRAVCGVILVFTR